MSSQDTDPRIVPAPASREPETPLSPETVVSELRRFMRFGPGDEEMLLALQPAVDVHAEAIADEFCRRVTEHHEAVAVFESPAQMQHVRTKLVEWLRSLFRGPWDDAYYQRRAVIGRAHVRTGLPQRYMFAGMSLLRIELTRVAEEAFAGDRHPRERARDAIARVLDLELALMLESFRESFVDRVQRRERVERTALQYRLAATEARCDEIIESAFSLIATFDAAGIVRLWNRRCEEMSGVPREEAVGQSFFELFVAQDERAHVRRLCDRVRDGGRAGGEHLRASWEGVSSRCTRGNCRVRWHFTVTPGDPDGEPLVCAIGLDVSEEHELSLRTRRAERLASLGTMAAGLAHEIRNPLNSAHLQLTVVQRRLSRASGADVAGALAATELVSAEVQRLASRVEKFLQFARPQPLAITRVDLRRTTAAVVEELRPDAETAGIALGLAPGSAVIATADEDRLRHVLQNLVRNALEATGRGGHVRLDVREGAGGAGHEAEISVEDDGPGLPSLDAPIFEPFFTTKPEGTGLGLAIVHRIVADHGGRVSVESRPGRTVFSVHVPIGAS